MVHQTSVGDLNKVWEIKALKKPGEEETRKILDKIAKQVQPIMRKHGWRVKLLSEFCPKNPALLGLNVGRGIHVKLRLRRPNRDWDFIPFDQVLDTMLHELCHNAHGPHNANFYKLWDQIRKECEDLMTKGITGTGEGFDVPGRRLGGFSRQPPVSSLRQTALAAAEKRSRLQSLLPSGPKQLGGDSFIMNMLSPIQAAAMAAERRLQDDIWCGSESCEISGEGENSDNQVNDPVHVAQTDNGYNEHVEDLSYRKRSLDSINKSQSQSFNDHANSSAIDLTMETSASGSMHYHNAVFQKRSRLTDMNNPHSQSLNVHPKPSFVDLSNETSTLEAPVLDHSVTNSQEDTIWECVSCTLLNPPLAPICELCSTTKPKDVEYKYKIWSCKFCTLENSVKLDKCAACGRWRYSYGHPVATSAPNLGT